MSDTATNNLLAVSLIPSVVWGAVYLFMRFEVDEIVLSTKRIFVSVLKLFQGQGLLISVCHAKISSIRSQKVSLTRASPLLGRYGYWAYFLVLHFFHMDKVTSAYAFTRLFSFQLFKHQWTAKKKIKKYLIIYPTRWVK